MNDAAIAAVRAAVAADPNNAELRLALAELLAAAGLRSEAVTEAATVLTTQPGNARAMTILTGVAQAAAAPAEPVAPTAPDEPAAQTAQVEPVAPDEPATGQVPVTPAWPAPPAPEAAPEQAVFVDEWAPPPAPGEVMNAAPPSGVGQESPAAPAPDTAAQAVPAEPAEPVVPAEPAAAADYDWSQAEQDLGSDVPPPFIEHTVGDGGEEGVAPLEPPLPRVTFEDVGGLENVKARLNESFIQPMRNAAIAQAFKKSLRGGLLLYGPPGCGKTFMARAVAGELEADFMSVVITDVVDGVHGQTEKNIHAVFQEARTSARKSPTVLFLDEIDALALKRSSMSGSSSWLRSTVNELLLEMDSMSGNNDGLYILAATNHPWDLDEAVMRPGRLDRSVLVSPPDPAARGAIMRRQLASRPVAGIHLETLVGGTEGFSGADLEHLVTTASEKAMMDSIQAGQVLPIGMNHLAEAMAEVRPSTAEWLASARNVVRFAADGGRYDDLRDYLEAHDGDQKKSRRKGWWS